MKLTLILGGVRAGKSARALLLARELTSNDEVLFVATAQAFDSEMEQRIVAHRAERSSKWQTVEEPIDIAGAIAAVLRDEATTRAVVVIDCLTLWVSNLLLSNEASVDVEPVVADAAHELVTMMQQHSVFYVSGERCQRHWIIVSNEVGLGIVPPTLLGRQYRDALGRVNQVVASAADRVILMVAGLQMIVK